MKTIFDKATRAEIIDRIGTLNESSTAQWGKMTVYQMLKHCSLWEEMVLGKTMYKQSFIGKLFGKMALKGMLKDDSPVKKNMPTVPGFNITGTGDVEAEKAKWIELIHEEENFANHNFVHPFFGKMTKEQIGCFAYKHIDHHLRQFGA
ncbi:DUF1569 domain-containing protein [Mucilaginibacter ginsenosidivorax]|uniref:DUF1569 domain-containing protein n=1 Tax=Mucilaginibacter ginsenosidivorax TaxID=862126 RepID=A0A5B8W3B9_9SPHI|nr:DUF1569 domain-containing protein [Mucilaginibacter ginsenosidivorax]QEC77366.1 DUF1569 domain-containing protein [Mucilaginibacter ginsenosidivorax]